MGARPSVMRELALVSTCNRMELYAYFDATVDDARGVLLDFLAHVHGLPAATFAKHTYFYQGLAVVQHLCRVAAGLESLVIGEAQILGQVTNAHLAAQSAKTLGPVLASVFRSAIRAGKRARAETAINVNPASTSSVAVSLAQSVAGDLRQRRVLIVGLGEIGQLTIKTLRGRGVTTIDVANRTLATARATAAQGEGDAYRLSELPQALAAADVVISATSAPTPLIDAAMIRNALAHRPGARLVLIDLAVPRDIDPAVAAIPGVHLFDVDDLRASLDEALSARQREIPHVETIIDEEMTAWQTHYQTLAIEPLVADLRQKAEAIRQREVARALHHLGDVDAQTVTQLHHLSRALVNQLLHEPTVRLKQKASADDVTEYANTVRDLFGLDGNE